MDLTRYPQRGVSSNQSNLLSDTPPWLCPLRALLLRSPDSRLAGPILSCEKDTHLQGWAHLYDSRILHLILPLLNTTCSTHISWEQAIDIEVSLTTTILEQGFGVSSLFPPFDVFTQRERQKVLAGAPNIREELSNCQNPMLSRNFSTNLSAVSEIGFFKFGGEVWRRKLFSQSFVDAILEATEKVLEINVSGNCYVGFSPLYS